MITFKNKVALVTGGGTGVGRAACIKLAEYGAFVIVNYAHSHKEALETVQMIVKNGGNATAIRADISKDSEVRKMILEVQNQFGGVHYLVNNAGITEQLDLADLEGVTDAMWEKLFSVNVKGAFYCTRAVVPFMKTQTGCSILNMGSIAGITGSGSSLPYAASKAAVHCLTKSLARALAPDIRVNCIAPAAISTRWWFGEEEKMYRLSGNLPLQRISTAEDIAELSCAVLAQDSMTGQIISPNNGMLI